MHIQNAGNPLAALISTQAAQESAATRKAAAEVRRRLAGFASSPDRDDALTQVEARSQNSGGDRHQPSQDDQEAFRGVFLSVES